MEIKPILFNTEMVKAILDGHKTQTRRTAFPTDDLRKFRNADFSNSWIFRGRLFETLEKFFRYPQRPRCKYDPGDILWVRETWSTHYDGIHDNLQYCYKADGVDLKAECMPGENNRWYPSIHMPKEAARIFLRVKDVRVEKLQDITAAGIRSEGLTSMCAFAGDMEIAFIEWRNLWNSTIKKVDLEKYGWDANPWVWVIEFERCEPPEGWCKK